jgi:hypothetical protein
MAFQPINFANIAPLESPWGDFVMHLGRGMEVGNRPRQMQQENEAARLSNSLKSVEAKYAPQTAEANLANIMSQAKQREAMSKLPFGGNIPGDVGQAIYANWLEKTGHPAAADARRARDTIFGTREMNIALGPKRAATTNQKLRMEDQEIMQDESLSPDQQQEMIYQNSLERQKRAVNPQLAVRAAAAEITEMGLDAFKNPKMREGLVAYAGKDGLLKRKQDEYTAFTTGKSPERAILNATAITQAKNTAHNLRVAIQESVSPARSEQLLKLIDAADFEHAPDEALRILDQTMDFFHKEKQILDRAVGKKSNSNSNQNNAPIQKFKSGAKFDPTKWVNQ